MDPKSVTPTSAQAAARRAQASTQKAVKLDEHLTAADDHDRAKEQFKALGVYAQSQLQRNEYTKQATFHANEALKHRRAAVNARAGITKPLVQGATGFKDSRFHPNKSGGIA